MYLADHDTRRNRLWAALATLLYALVWGLLVVLVTFRVHAPEPPAEGILIDFGVESEPAPLPSSSAGTSTESAPAASDTPQPAAVSGTDTRLTQQIEEAPAVPPPPTPTVDPRALFPGRTSADNDTPGTAQGGSGGGSEAAGTGSGDVDLSGRSLVGSLPKPAYNAREEGRVVIEVHVDQQGRVVRAAYRSRGSTTTNATLVAAAERAARAARFDVKEDAAVTQIGTITYNFRIVE